MQTKGPHRAGNRPDYFDAAIGESWSGLVGTIPFTEQPLRNSPGTDNSFAWALSFYWGAQVTQFLSAHSQRAAVWIDPSTNCVNQFDDLPFFVVSGEAVTLCLALAQPVQGSDSSPAIVGLITNCIPRLKLARLPTRSSLPSRLYLLSRNPISRSLTTFFVCRSEGNIPKTGSIVDP